MPPRHILIVNARNVTQPVFVIGAPHSGAEAVGRALKLSPGFHVTIGQQSVLQAVYGFARAVDDMGDEAPPDERSRLLDELEADLGRLSAALAFVMGLAD